MKFLVSLFTTMSSSTCFSHCRWYSGSLSTPHENCTVLPTCTVWLCGPSVIMGGCTGRTAHTLSLCVSSRQPAATYWHWSFQQPSDRQHNLTLHKQLCTCRGSIQHAMWFRNLTTIAKLYKNPIWKGCNGWMTFKVPFYRHYMLISYWSSTVTLSCTVFKILTLIYHQKLESLSYCLHDPMFSHFNRSPTQSNSKVLCGKNQWHFVRDTINVWMTMMTTIIMKTTNSTSYLPY